MKHQTKQNKNLKGDALKKAVDQKKWDDSIKALAATPDVLGMLSDKLDWTQELGDAVLAQQTDVMDAIQRLRQKAQANDKLKTTKQQKVTTTQQSGKTYVAIEPAGLTRRLTRYVLEEALAQLRDWHDAGLDLGVAVNVSEPSKTPARLAPQARPSARPSQLIAFATRLSSNLA